MSGEFGAAVGFAGGDDRGNGEALNQVLLTVEQGTHGDVAGGAIGGKNEIGDRLFGFGLQFLLQLGREHPPIEFLANLFDSGSVGCGTNCGFTAFHFAAKRQDGGGEFCLADVDFVAGEDGAGAADQQPHFVV